MITVHIISHTHWDREWYASSKYTNPWLVPFFEKLFEMLDEQEDYRFVLDGQTAMIEDWLEQLILMGKDWAGAKEKLEDFARQGRIIIGPYYLQPDWQLISEEAMVRNLLTGRRIANQYGSTAHFGWLPDNFGQISQAPQIHKEFGIKGIFVWRGVEMNPDEMKSEFLWVSPDETEILGIYLISGYRNAMRLAAYPKLIYERINNESSKLGEFRTTDHILLMNGYDQEMLPDDILPYIRNNQADTEHFRVVQSTPEEYLEAVQAQNPTLQKLYGAMYSGRYISVFPGVLSSRIYLKQSNHDCQQQLAMYTDPAAALVCMGRQPESKEYLDELWKLLMKNHPHDSICGVSADEVHEDMEKRFARCRMKTGEAFDYYLSCIATNIHIPKGVKDQKAYMIYNPYPLSGSQVIELPERDKEWFDEKEERLIAVSSAEGMLVWLKDIPAFGYQVIKCRNSAEELSQRWDETPDETRVVKEWEADHTRKIALENAHLLVTVNADGTLDVEEKQSGKRYHHIGELEESADVGDEYSYSYPAKDDLYYGKESRIECTVAENNELRGVVEIRHLFELPESFDVQKGRRSETLKPMQVVTRLTLEKDSPYLSFKTRVTNQIKDHRLRVLFPTRLDTDISYAQSAFAIDAHPILGVEKEYPPLPSKLKKVINGARERFETSQFSQHDFCAVTDGKSGVAIFNKGLPEYQVCKEQTTIAVTLFRSVGWLARTDLLTRQGDAGPEIAAPGAQCLREMVFEYAIHPFQGRLEESDVLVNSNRFQYAVIGKETDFHEGFLPQRHSFLNIQGGGMINVSAIKIPEKETGLIVRMYHAGEKEEEITLTTGFPVDGVGITDLAEDSSREYIESMDQNTLRFQARPNKIITLHLKASPFLEIPQNQEKEMREEEKRIKSLRSDCEEAREKSETAWNTYRKESRSKAAKTEAYVRNCDYEAKNRVLLEAELSFLYMKKNCLGRTQKLTKNADQQIHDQIKEKSLMLNRSRLSKRVSEYLLE